LLPNVRNANDSDLDKRALRHALLSGCGPINLINEITFPCRFSEKRRHCILVRAAEVTIPGPPRGCAPLSENNLNVLELDSVISVACAS
jgi:hypothetical protein